MPQLHMARELGAAGPRVGGDRLLPSGRMPGSLLAALPCSPSPSSRRQNQVLHQAMSLQADGFQLPAYKACRDWLLLVFPSFSALSTWQGNEHFLVSNLWYGPEHKQPITEDKMNT